MLGNLLEAWLASKRDLKPTTRAGYRRHIDRHLRSLADMDAARLSSDDLVELYERLQRNGLSGSTVRAINATMRASLDWAVRRNMLARNAAASIPPEDLPRRLGTEMTAWGPSEIGAILEAAPVELKALYSLIARTGLRRGEALALRWEDVSVESNTLRIERSLVPRPGGGLDLLTPKTRRSRRTVDVPPSTLKMLTGLRHEQTARRLASGLQPGEYGDLIFTGWDGVSPLSPTTVSRSFRKAVRRAKVKPGRLHDLRHSFASIAISAGVPITVVSRSLGHGQVSTTADTYAHLMPGTSGQATRAVDAALEGRAGLE